MMYRRRPGEQRRPIRATSAWLGALALALALPARAVAEERPPRVLIGNAYCFMIRRPDGALTARQRADAIQDVFARHLGSGQGSFTLRKAPRGPGGRVEIRLNGDPVITVTDADALATRYRTASELAPIWKQALVDAFNATQSQPRPGR